MWPELEGQLLGKHVTIEMAVHNWAQPKTGGFFFLNPTISVSILVRQTSSLNQMLPEPSFVSVYSAIAYSHISCYIRTRWLTSTSVAGMTRVPARSKKDAAGECLSYLQ